VVLATHAAATVRLADTVLQLPGGAPLTVAEAAAACMRGAP